MTEMVAKTKHTVWKYLGAMMMEEKDGHQAVSYTRTLGVVLFACCLVAWMVKAFMVPGEGEMPSVGDLPDMMVYTLWSLIGIKGAKDVAKGLKGAA